ncbi:MAG: ACP S-malonyltransferase, partial [bacterium]|nr:ACP S-malonyltransferase [bacterium]
KKNILFTPCCTCGHSLGEFSALWLIGFLSTDELIKLVSIRGNLMQNAPPGSMMAVLNLDESKIKNLINESGGNITLANYNTSNQFVISGEKDNIKKLTEKIKLNGGKAIILPVSGAFHSPLMEGASKAFNLEIDKLNLSNIKNISIPVYQNTDGNPSKDPLIIKEKLKKQMTSSVLWTQTINNLVKDGVTTVVEIGPGKILTGLVEKINPDIECHNINDLITLKEFILFYESKLQSTRQSKTT